MPETSSDESVKEMIVPLGAGATLSCEASSALMRSSASSPSVTYSWSKYQGNMAKDIVMQGVSDSRLGSTKLCAALAKNDWNLTSGMTLHNNPLYYIRGQRKPWVFLGFPGFGSWVPGFSWVFLYSFCAMFGFKNFALHKISMKSYRK